MDNYVPSSEYSFECAPGCDTTVRHASLSLPAPIYEFQRYSRSIKWTYKKISQVRACSPDGVLTGAVLFAVSSLSLPLGALFRSWGGDVQTHPHTHIHTHTHTHTLSPWHVGPRAG